LGDRPFWIVEDFGYQEFITATDKNITKRPRNAYITVIYYATAAERPLW
jgi:hypothetical protein